MCLYIHVLLLNMVRWRLGGVSWALGLSKQTGNRVVAVVRALRFGRASDNLSK